MNLYETNDLALATYLLYEKFVLEEVKENDYNPKKKIFCFRRIKNKKIEDTVDMFYRDMASVNPQRYFSFLTQLKNAIWHYRRQDREREERQWPPLLKK